MFFFFCYRYFGTGYSKLSDTLNVYELVIISQITIINDFEFDGESIIECDDKSNRGKIVLESGGSLTYKGKTSEPSEIINLVFYLSSISSMFILYILYLYTLFFLLLFDIIFLNIYL
jgi:hypothetical protein